MDLSNFACRAIKQTETVWELFHNLLRHLSLSWPALPSSFAYLATFSLEFSQGWANTRQGECGLLCHLYSHSPGVFVFQLCVSVCVSLYNLQLSFILQLFFAPKTFVYMANTRASTRVCHTYTQGEGSQPGSDCFSWLSRPPTPGPPLYPSIPFPASCSLSKVLLHQSFCYASLSFFGPPRLSSQNLSRLLFLRRELESSSNWSRL